MYAVEVTLARQFKSQHFLMLEKKDFFEPTTTLNVSTKVFDELRRPAPASSSPR